MAGSQTASLSAEKKVKQRARILAHNEVTKNVSATCRYFGISHHLLLVAAALRHGGDRGAAGPEQSAHHDSLPDPAGGDRLGVPDSPRTRVRGATAQPLSPTVSPRLLSRRPRCSRSFASKHFVSGPRRGRAALRSGNRLLGTSGNGCWWT